MLSSVATLSDYPPVFVENGSAMPISHVGSSCLPNPNRPLYLNNVLVAPNLIKNLLSVRRLTTDNNCSVEYDPCGLSVKDYPTKVVLVRCISDGELYDIFPPAAPTALAVTVSRLTDLWHRHLGHPAMQLFV